MVKVHVFDEPCIESFFVLAVMTFLARLSQDEEQGLISCFDVERRLPTDDQAFEDDMLDIERTDLPQRDKPRLVDFLSDNADHSCGRAEDDILVGLMVGGVGRLLELQINGFLGAATVPTPCERSNFAFFFFNLK